MKGLIIYGSTTGNTETMAEMVEKALADAGLTAEIKEAANAAVSDLTAADQLVLLGCPAYGDDEVELQEDFQEFYEKWDGVDLSGKKFAVFAPGDTSYEHFCGTVDFLEEKIQEMGGTVVVPGLKIDGDPGDAADEISSWCQDVVNNA